MKHLIAAASAAIVLAFAGSASAATIVLNYQGYVSSGAGFGGGNDLTGEALLATVTIDDSKAPSTYSPTFSRTRGGSDFNTLGPVSVIVTIRGVDYAIDGQRNSTGSQLLLSDTEHMYQESIGAVAGLQGGEGHFRGWVIGYNAPFLSSSDYHLPVAVGQGTGRTLGGEFGITQGGQYVGYVNFNALRVSVPGQEIPSIPEPSTWAMLLIGFGAVGAAIRSQARTKRGFAALLPH